MAGISLGLGTLIAGLAGAGATTYATAKSAGAAKKAGDIQANAAAEALAFERERDARDYEQYQRELARQEALENQARQVALEDRARREALLGPYRDFGAEGARTVGALLGFEAPRAAVAPLQPTDQPIPSAAVPPKPPAPGAVAMPRAVTRGTTVADLVAMPSGTDRPPTPVARAAAPRRPTARTIAELAALAGKPIPRYA